MVYATVKTVWGESKSRVRNRTWLAEDKSKLHVNRKWVAAGGQGWKQSYVIQADQAWL
jgi:hypothetical protein